MDPNAQNPGVPVGGGMPGTPQVPPTTTPGTVPVVNEPEQVNPEPTVAEQPPAATETPVPVTGIPDQSGTNTQGI